jgi:hypothetical protein
MVLSSARRALLDTHVTRPQLETVAKRYPGWRAELVENPRELQADICHGHKPIVSVYGMHLEDIAQVVARIVHEQHYTWQLYTPDNEREDG